MRLLIVRTYPNVLDFNTYNIQEIGLAKALAKNGISADVVLYNGWNKTYEENVSLDDGEDKTFNIYHMRGFGILKNGFFPGLMKLASGYDIIQVHEYDQITSWLFYVGHLRNKVIMYHGPYYNDFNKGYNFKCRVFDHTFLKLAHNRDTLCFTKSHAAADFLRGKGFEHVVPVGVGLDMGAFDCVDTSVIEKDTSRYTFIYVGKLEPRRNSIFLMQLMDRLMSELDDIDMILVGDGEDDYRKETLDVAKPWIEKGRIKYLPRATQQELAIIYRQADCMLFPSIYEIFGMVLMEALYCGLSVISSKNGGADMLIEDGINGYIVPTFSLDDWYQKCRMLYESRAKAGLTPSDSFSWDTVAKRIVNGIETYEHTRTKIQ